MGGKASRTKGHNFERWVANEFRNHFPGLAEDIKRGHQTRTGEEAPDVDGTPFWIEAKRHKKVNIKAALKQATEDSQGTRVPLAITKDDYGPVLVTMYLDDFFSLFSAAQKNAPELLLDSKADLESLYDIIGGILKSM